jgi:chromosome segregation ATPase
MPRRTAQTVDPLSAQSRTLAVGSAGDLDLLRSDFRSDKAIKDSKIATLEADKTTQDSKLSTLEADKADKDTRVSALESDKNDKDTRVSALESDKINKDTRMNTAETKITTLENSATGIVDGGRADVQHLEATDINGGSASI